MGRALRSYLPLVGLFGALGCQADTATQVLVFLRAEPGFEDAVELEIRVEGADGTVAYEGVTSLVDPRPEPLARLPLIPEGGDATRGFRVQAKLRDASAQVLAELEAAGGYQQDELRELNLWFEAACRGVSACGRGRTCQAGTCVGACFAPAPVGAEGNSRARCGECERCSDRLCTAVADQTPCGCPSDQCMGGACDAARPVTTVVGGQLHTCAAVSSDLYCFGSNRVGQLGTNGTSTTSPVRVGTGGWSEGTAAQEHTCMVRNGGGRACWGWNGQGQLGTGIAETQANKLPVPGPDGDPEWTNLASGWFHTCGLTKDRQVACWGNNEHGASGQPDPTGPVLLPAFVDEAHNWSAIAAGGFHSCGLRNDGTLWCWGLNESGELGVGDSADRLSPTQTGCPDGQCLSDWIAVGSGSFHTCAIRSNGELWCWGGGLNGQLGVGPLANEDSAQPLRVAEGHWRAIGGGSSHSCGIQDDGSLWCWGKNEDGQLGLGDTEPRLVPARVEVAGKNEWIRVGVGREHSCAIRSDRSLWCWGKSANGQLGIGQSRAGPIVTRPTRVCLPPN